MQQPARKPARKPARSLIALKIVTLLTSASLAGPDDFTTGPLITAYGPVADVPGAAPLPADTTFFVSFDVVKGAEPGALNRSLESAARFLNMHVAAGVKPEALHLALVLHGPSVFDVTRARRYTAKYEATKSGVENANAALVATLLKHGVKIYVCGQSAAYQDVRADDLLPGVTLSLSAMTAHAQLQKAGYTLNPF